MTPILRKSKESSRLQRAKPLEERRRAVPTTQPLGSNRGRPPRHFRGGPPQRSYQQPHNNDPWPIASHRRYRDSVPSAPSMPSRPPIPVESRKRRSGGGDYYDDYDRESKYSRRHESPPPSRRDYRLRYPPGVAVGARGSRYDEHSMQASAYANYARSSSSSEYQRGHSSRPSSHPSRSYYQSVGDYGPRKIGRAHV